MPIIRRDFIEGKMNKDADERLLPKSQYRDGLNIRVSNSEGDEVGSIENSLGNKQKTNLDVGANAVTIGALAETFNDTLYYWVVSDSGSYVCEYNERTGLANFVLKDTRVADENVLNFSKDYLITGCNAIVDSDNNVIILKWTDGLNPPRMINVDRSKTYAENGFDDADISVIKAPPENPPEINLSETVDALENNIEERFLRFATRYQYLDGEYSAPSAFSEVAFMADTFAYDFALASNESMVNRFNEVLIEFNTGSKNVKAVDIIFKESGSNNVYIVDHFVKEEEGWNNDELVNFTFSNNKLYKNLGERQLFRLFDAVPLTALAQERIGNRTVYGNYTENYDIADCDGNAIKIDFNLETIHDPINNFEGVGSLKSIRDYEVGIVYLDDNGRMTTVLDSADNTIFIGNSNSVTQNKIQVNVNHKAPCFAKKFRFFIKQNRYDYETIVPTLFYQDGVFVWIKLEGNEGSKINEGDFLYVKADTQEILSEAQQTRVLEIKSQDRNFLDPDATTTEQLSGLYFRIKPDGFRINEDDFTLYTFTGYDNTSNAYDSPIRNNTTYIEDAIYYGVNGLDDLTKGGTYTHNEDIRYLIEIDSVGATDTFRWSDDDGQNWTDNVSITGAAQLLNNGVEITFGAITGHLIDDSWVVSAKSSSDNNIATDMNSKSYAIFKGIGEGDTDGNKDVIEGGANIRIVYNEYENTVEFVEQNFISSRRYENIEEWFYGDNIDLGIDDNRIWFRRGTVGNDGNARFIDMGDTTKEMSMIIRSSGTQNNDVESRVKVGSTLEIFQSDQNIIFETKPLDENSDIFYEIGRTYSIDENFNHLGYNADDTDQTNSNAGVFVLPVINCFAWGNGFESYKIKDLFNANTFKIDTRPLTTVEDYRRNKRIASLTYSQPYDQSTNYNGVNEFNVSTANFKDLDDAFGSIQKLHSENTNLIVFQEDKVHKVLYQKDVLFDADGEGNVKESNNVLGQEVPYHGEYGISTNPESFAVYGHQKYFTDAKRGAVLRLSTDGITEISNYGMRDFFRDSFNTNLTTKKIGGYDPYHDQYVLHVDDEKEVQSIRVDCGGSLNVFESDTVFNYTLNINDAQSTVFINYNVSGTITISVNNNGTIELFENLTGVGQVSFEQTQSGVTEMSVSVTPVSTLPSYTIDIPCIIQEVSNVVANDDSISIMSGESFAINVLNNDIYENPVTINITSQGAEGNAVVNPDNTIQYNHEGNNSNPDSFEYTISDGNSFDDATVTINVESSGGGTGEQGQSFNISSQSFFSSGSNGQGACDFILNATKYHNGSFLNPTLGDTIYNDVDKTSVFNGFNNYWNIPNGRSIRITATGQVTDVFICGDGNA
ncbi:MAG: Ig-like domain-containing protein [bacterium]